MKLRVVMTLVALLAATSCAQSGARARSADEGGRQDPSVDSARELDQAGVRIFKEGRYADAIRYFRAAYRMGAPSSELWNIARCKERLDDAEGAAQAIDEYLAQRDLSPSDRADAEREVRALRARPSLLTITTNPPGAMVMLDGKPAGTTPLTVDVASGSHTLAVRHDGYAADSRPLEARFGRAVIVSLDLAREGK